MNAPPVQLLNRVTTSRIKDTEKVRENRLPHSQLKLVKEIRYIKRIEIKAILSKSDREGILARGQSVTKAGWAKRTRVGVIESGSSIRFM